MTALLSIAGIHLLVARSSEADCTPKIRQSGSRGHHCHLQRLRLGRIECLHDPSGAKSKRMKQRKPRVKNATDTFSTDVRSVRRDHGMTQQAFADTFGFTVGAVRDWEQGRKRPDRAARILLAVIQSAPEVVANAVADVGNVAA